MPRLTGTASTMAMVALTSVPTMKPRAPNTSALGAQRDSVNHSRPMSRNAGHARLVVVTAMRARTARTRPAATTATVRKPRSAAPPLPWSVRGALAMSLVRSRLHGRQLGQRLLAQPVGQRGVIDAGSLVLTVGQDVAEEGLE